MNAKDTAGLMRFLKLELKEAEGFIANGKIGLALNKIKNVQVVLEDTAERLDKSSEDSN